jgi:hypothetical protein
MIADSREPGTNQRVMATPVKIFISYAHPDEYLLSRLQQHLGGLRHWGVVQAFDDRGIRPGDEWDAKIRRELEAANLVLLLVSPDFLASAYCNATEVRRAIERHATGELTVVPIAMKPCHWGGTPFEQLQGLPRGLKPVVTWPDVDLAFQEIVAAIHETVQVIAGREGDQKETRTTLEPKTPKSELQPVTVEFGANPYRGLEVFREEDADRFFGREELTDEVYAVYRALHEETPAKPSVRLLAVIGPSGSGKSSFARAGLVPRISREPLPGLASAKVVTFVPQANPLYQLGLALARYALADKAPVHKANEFAETMAKAGAGRRFDGLRKVVGALPEYVPRHLHLLIDQFEEVYALCDDDAERNAFVATCLDAASDPGGRISVILTLRSDFLGA